MHKSPSTSKADPLAERRNRRSRSLVRGSGAFVLAGAVAAAVFTFTAPPGPSLPTVPGSDLQAVSVAPVASGPAVHEAPDAATLVSLASRQNKPMRTHKPKPTHTPTPTPTPTQTPTPTPTPTPTATATPPAEVGGWTVTDTLATARVRHAAARLADGRVLVAGGADSAGARLSSAELFTPASGTWQAAADMPIAVADAAAVTLPDGTVLVAGGAGYATELYDPATNSWTTGPALPASNTGPTFATTLPDGTVFVMGTSAAAYNPVTKTWRALANPPTMGVQRSTSWTTLANGDLATTSTMQYGGGTIPPAPLTGPSVYHWVTDTWTTTPTPYVDPNHPIATGLVPAALPNGNIMIAGGNISYIWFPATSHTVMEVNPTTGVWTTDAELPRYSLSNLFVDGSQLVQLPNGSILAAGGNDIADVDYVYSPDAGAWTQVPGRTASDSTFTTLADGSVLAAGGYAYGDPVYGGFQRAGATNQAAIYTP